ncbi:MAG: hypothetical protein J0J01_23200 [Reyranella sp.]|uniref:hypothetical protein n=1 Tax=Reyranella sp. TaxID=1929291 RepID=UPI001AD24241|nr:hypothetical protein [Reyranella sp.]MBN9089830.1 hypothetical protein [Reyranella sp.]
MSIMQANERQTFRAKELRDRVGDTEITRMLAVALAMGADRGLKEELRGLAGATAGSAFAVSQPGQDVWLTVEADRVVAARHKSEGIALVEGETLRANGRTVARAMAGALARSTALADATKLIGPLLGPAETPSRQEFAALLPWAPALEQVAYKTAASIAVTLDLLRAHIVPSLHAGMPVPSHLLRQYWQRMHAAAQFFLLASDAAASPWLGEMARQFDWVNWTPSFTLLRERTTWLAACAARSAAAFGEPVVACYLAKLEAAPHPFKAFDALFGLAAIALGNPALAPAIAAELRVLQRLADAASTPSPFVRRACLDAIEVIEGTADWAGGGSAEVEALGWKDAKAGLASEVALRTDPALVTQADHVLGFAILPTAFETPVAHFNPGGAVRRRVRQSTPLDVVAEVVLGAWAPPAPRAGRVLH